MARAPTTPTTSPARPWSTCGTGSRPARETSRTRAYELLRGLTYLQDASGPDAGNVVLWMQHNGTLTPSATPKDDPDPSDSSDSYWLARTVWALGEGYADFAGSGGDPVFASFLRDRLDLAVAAMNRENLARYGTFQQVDGTRTPAWLIAHGADASAEAVLGLSAYRHVGLRRRRGSHRAARAVGRHRGHVRR